MMEIKNTLSHIPELQFKRNLFLVLVLLLAVVVIVQSFAIVLNKSRHRTIIVPAHINQGFWVDDNGVSEQYLAEMARFLSQQFLNLTPDNSDTQLAYVLQWVHPAYYATVKQQFIDLHQTFKDKAMTTVFYPQTVDVFLKEMQVNLNGLFDVFVAGQKLERQSITVHLQFHYQAGQLTLLNVERVSHEEH